MKLCHEVFKVRRTESGSADKLTVGDGVVGAVLPPSPPPPPLSPHAAIINKVMKLCFQNYSLMNTHIYKVIHDVLFKTTNQQYIIANREILKIRLLEIKPYINHSSTIPLIYQGNYEDTEDTDVDDAEAIANDDDYYDYDYD